MIRFTGREIVRNAAGCVAEVRAIYKERMQRAPAKYRAMYIDYHFLEHQAVKAHRFYREIHPGKTLKNPSLEELVPHAIDWLHEKSFITAFVFHLPDGPDELFSIDGLVMDYEKGEIRVNTIADEFYSIELGSHLVGFSHLFDEFYLVADDPVYVTPLQSVISLDRGSLQLGACTFKPISNAKLLRKSNKETSFSGTDLAYVRWQDIWYPIGTAMGLMPFEL